MFQGSNWICIEEAVDDFAVHDISGALHTTAVTLYAIDEKIPRFAYQHVVDGCRVRQLVFEYSGYPMRGKWTRIDGEPEAWEALLFPDSATAEPCDLRVLYSIARALQLPWPRSDSARAEVIR